MLDCTIAYELSFLFPSADDAVGASLRDNGEFSKVELDFLLDMACADGTLVDVGANIGSIALPVAKARPDWKVVAVEASRMTSGLLAANTLNNRLLNVQVVNAAVGAEREIVEFPALHLGQSGNFGAIGFGQAHTNLELIGMLPLDEIADISATLIKIDVEGFEPQVLRGAKRLLAAQTGIWLVEATPQHPEACTEVIRVFRDAGYTLYWFFVPFATPTSPKAKPMQAMKGDANIVALPPGTPNTWNLTPVGSLTESRPSTLADYPYLARYGFPSQAA